MSDRLAARIVEEAEHLWRENPPPCTIAERNEWGWHCTRRGFEWCGHTVATILRAVGLRPELAKTVFASTARLADKGPAGSRWRDHGLVRPAVPTSALRAGDVACVVTGENKSYGDHIVVVVDGPDTKGFFRTVEGNAKGALHEGGWAKGVVTRERNVKDVRQVLRITEEHLTGQ